MPGFGTMWNFTIFFPKGGPSNYKEDYANITFFINNLFWTEQEIQRNQNIFRKSLGWSLNH